MTTNAEILNHNTPAKYIANMSNALLLEHHCKGPGLNPQTIFNPFMGQIWTMESFMIEIEEVSKIKEIYPFARERAGGPTGDRHSVIERFFLKLTGKKISVNKDAKPGIYMLNEENARAFELYCKKRGLNPHEAFNPLMSYFLKTDKYLIKAATLPGSKTLLYRTKEQILKDMGIR